MTEQIVKVQTNKTCFNWCVWNWGFTKQTNKKKKLVKAGHMLCILEGEVRGKFKGLN